MPFNVWMRRREKTTFFAGPLVYLRVTYLSEGHLSYFECTAKYQDQFQSLDNVFVGPSVRQAG